ncbi:MAG: hypothetical protein AAGE03_04050 [Pseudomonadota bacterium]
MLALYDMTQDIPGVVVYRDHQDLGQFYYMLMTPRISMANGRPALSLVKFRRDITDNPDFQEGDSLGGGILTFSCDLALTEDELRRVRSSIPRRFEDVPDNFRLAPISVRDGTVRLSAMRDAADNEDAPPDAPRGLQLFEEVLGSTRPAMIGDQRATFTVMLSREMTTVMEETLRGGISTFGVFYSLKFMAMRSAFSIKAEADYKRVYNHLETELGVQAQIKVVSIAADVGLAFQKLRDEGIVKVEVTRFTDDDDLNAKADEAWEWIKGELIKDLFETSLAPPGIMAPDRGTGMLGTLQSLFGAMPPMTGTSLAPPRGTASGPPATAPAPANLSDGVQPAAATNAAQAGARAPAGGGNLVSELSPFRIGFSLKSFRQEELKVRRFDFTMQAAVEQEANPNGMFSAIADGFNLDRHIFEIDMDDDFFDRVNATVSMAQDLASVGIASVAVNMEYPANRPSGTDADHFDGFLFRPGETDTHSFTTFLNDARERDYRYRMTITFDAQTEWLGRDSQIETDWVTSADRQVPLAPMNAIDLFEVQVALSTLANEAIAQVEVEVAYRDPGSGFEDRRTFLLTPSGGPQSWKLRLPEGAPRTYTYRVRYFFAESNLRVEAPEEETTDPALVINPPFRGLQRVMINPMLLDMANLLQAIVDVEYTEPDTGYRVSVRKEFEPGTPLTPERFDIPTLQDVPEPVRFTSTIIGIDGTVSTQDLQEAPNGIIVLSESEGVTQRITVRLPPAGMGAFIALKVDLTSQAETADRTSAFFTPGDADPQVVALVGPQGATRDYDFNITGYDGSGRPVPVASGTAADATFVVPVA